MNFAGTLVLIAVLGAVGYFAYWAIQRTMKDSGKSIDRRQRKGRR
jgi:cbb3-type cytochrome oxidase subunit 3